MDSVGPVLIVFGGLLLAAVVVGLVVIGIFNKLVRLRNQFQNAFAQIDVQLKRRYELIPNLVETVKGYLKHERETLESVISARNQAMAAGQQAAQKPGDPTAMRQLGAAEGALGGALSRLMVVAEAYPELKANESMQGLQEELTSTENKVAFARQAFNDGVTAYNIAREQFPAVILAGAFGFHPATLLEITAEHERQAPQVSFE